MSIVEYLEKTEGRELIEKMRRELTHVIGLMPAKNADLFLHCLSLVKDEDRERFIAFFKNEDLINNRSLLLSVYGSLASTNMISNAILAAEVADDIVGQKIKVEIDNLLSDFRSAVATILVEATDELQKTGAAVQASANHAASQIKEAQIGSVSLVQEFDNQVHERKKEHLIEMGNQFRALEVQRGDELNKMWKKEMAPFVKEIFAWRGIAVMVFVVTSSMLLVNGLERVVQLFLH